jgi:rubrerythrin
LKLHTASEVISLARRLENESADFYERIGHLRRDEDVWHGFALENRRNVTQVDRAYYGVISDALEGGFAFDIDAGDFEPDISAAEAASYESAVEQTVRAEELIARFYSTAAAQSQSLLADIPRLFKTIAQKRTARIQLIRSTLNGNTVGE